MLLDAVLLYMQVACGGMNSVVLTDTGEVWTWGEPWGDFAIDTQRAPRKVWMLCQLSVCIL
jgi:alpha-tubulin suppressor-like RCC1 family protein